LRHAAVWLFLIGTSADYVLTFIGLKMGFREMNPWVGTPFGFSMVFAVAGLILAMGWLIERFKLNGWWFMPYLVAGLEWFAVPWNLYVISTAL